MDVVLSPLPAADTILEDAADSECLSVPLPPACPSGLEESVGTGMVSSNHEVSGTKLAGSLKSRRATGLSLLKSIMLPMLLASFSRRSSGRACRPEFVVFRTVEPRLVLPPRCPITVGMMIDVGWEGDKDRGVLAAKDEPWPQVSPR